MTAQLQNLVYYALMGVAIYFMFRRGGCCGGGHTASHHTNGGGCCGGGHKHGDDQHPHQAGQTTEMVRDPICGMTIPKDESIRINVGGRDYYFCSEDCANEFRNRGGQS